ncbi:MAG: hypothetical protein ABW168_29320 [Sedimenticola sp.]
MTESFWRVSIDQTTPEIAATITPPANAAGWHNSDPTLSFACSDALSGVLSCSEPIVVTTEGQTQSFTGSAIDNADNSRDVGVSINLDKTPPVITATVEPLPNTAGWQNSDVQISFVCSDTLSGIASCPDPVLISSQPDNYAYSD